MTSQVREVQMSPKLTLEELERARTFCGLSKVLLFQSLRAKVELEVLLIVPSMFIGDTRTPSTCDCRLRQI